MAAIIHAGRRLTDWLYELIRTSRFSVLAALGMVTFLLGFFGFRAYYIHLGDPRRWDDLVYLTVQLFVMESGSVPKANLAIEIARFLAPLLTFVTALRTAFVLFPREIDWVRLSRANGHVVIVGLGRRGALVARALRERGERVVVVDRGDDQHLVDECRAEGVIVLTGDVTSGRLLERARVGQARYLISVCGDDATNADVALKAAALTAGRRVPPLICKLHIDDPKLCDELRLATLDRLPPDRLLLEYFSIFEDGARAMLDTCPALAPSTLDPARVHLLIAGFGKLGQAIAAEVARRAAAAGESRSAVPITVLDRAAGRKIASLAAQYPDLHAAWDIQAAEMEVPSGEFYEAAFLRGKNARPNVTHAFICFDDDSLGLYVALALRRADASGAVTILVRSTRETGIADLLPVAERTVDGPGPWTFKLIERTCTADMILAPPAQDVAPPEEQPGRAGSPAESGAAV